ncbi:MAG: hypothetical protein WCL61_03970 [bacterium]
MNYQGIIVEESLENKSILDQLEIKKIEVEEVTEEHKTPWIKTWTMKTVEIPEAQAGSVAEKISQALDSQHAWFADFQNDTTHYIIFKNKVFCVKDFNQKQYDEAKTYGISLGIPEYQVDFHPESQQWIR